MARKIKKSERQKAIEKADKYCSLYVRLSHADKNGYCTCYTCGKRKHWKEIQCGHWIGRMSFSVRWNLDNLRPQCVGCNDKRWGNGRPMVFKAKLIDEIGIERVNAVEEKALDEARDIHHSKVDTPDILKLVDYFKDLLVPYKHILNPNKNNSGNMYQMERD